MKKKSMKKSTKTKKAKKSIKKRVSPLKKTLKPCPYSTYTVKQLRILAKNNDLKLATGLKKSIIIRHLRKANVKVSLIH